TLVIPVMHYRLEQVNISARRHSIKKTSFLERDALCDASRRKPIGGAGQALGEGEKDDSHAGVSLKDGHQNRSVAPANIHHGSHAPEVINGSEGPRYATRKLDHCG